MVKEKVYMIAYVSTKYDIHPQTLRLYEREGLLVPSRSKGNTRLYTEKDLKKLEFILNLSRDMGVNLAGIDIIYNMKLKIERMEEEFSKFLEELKKEFFTGKENLFDQKRNSLVKMSSPRIALFKDDSEK